MAREGARLVLNDLGCETDGTGSDPSVVQAAVAELRSTGAEALGDDGDLRSPGAPRRLIDLARSALGPLDCVVGCAGIGHDRSLRKTTDDEVARVLDLHVRATFALVREASSAFIAQGTGGSILLMTGPIAYFGAARQSVAAAAAAAVVGLIRSAAVELRRHRVRVNGIAPTARTRLTADLPLFRGVSEDSMGPGHVAPVAAYLASDEAADVSGEVLGVAGGRVYAFRCKETTGALVEGRAFTPEEVGSALDEIILG